MSELDDWLAKKRDTSPVTPKPSTTGGSDLDQWLAKRKQGGPRRVAPSGADLLGEAERESRQAAGMVGELPAGPGVGENVSIGAGRTFYNRILPAASSIAEVTEGMQRGNFGPAWQMTKEAVRGAYHALKPPDPQVTRDASGNVTGMELRPPDPTLVAAQQERQRRYQASPDFQRAQLANQRLNSRARLDPSMLGKTIRGASEAITSAAPVVAAGAAGGLPGVAMASAAMSADNPSQMGPNAAMAVLPTPGIGALAKRLRGKPEAAPQRQLFETAPKLSTMRRAGQIASDVYNLPRAAMASADISAPLRQGAILTLPPSQWGRAAKAGIRMFQSFKSDRFKQIAGELNSAPDAPVAKQAGLHLSTDRTGVLRKTEEDFLSSFSERLPIIKQSNQAYSMYLDSLRLDTFSKYKRVIDKNALLSGEEKLAAYNAAANWINVATGRGSLGQTLDKAMPAMGYLFFAPRYVASRINVLDPRTYLRNASTPAGRMVLKQQMSDLVQFAGMVSATIGLAKAAGADVNTEWRSSDFLKMRFGNYRYDALAGLQQVMRLFYRLGDDAQRAARGLPAKQGEGTLDVASRFARSKLAPVPSYFVDALARRDYTGQPFEPGKGALDRVTPLIWNDFVEAYQKEGFGGAAKNLPGLVGVGVANFENRSGSIQSAGNFAAKLQEHGIEPDFAKRLKGEPEDLYNARLKRIEDWSDKYGNSLVDHPGFEKLTPVQQRHALKALRESIHEEANDRYPNLSLLEPGRLIYQAKESEREKAERGKRKFYSEP